MLEPVRIQLPAWPPTTHVDLFVYRTPIVIPHGQPAPPATRLELSSAPIVSNLRRSVPFWEETW